MKSSATIVVPCYNEAERLPINEFKDFVRAEPSHQFILVNDGSTDGTLRRLEDLCDFAPARFAVCNLATNTGKAEATRRGMLLSMDSGSAYVGYWDADLATPLQTISTFCELLDANPQIEMVFGARVRMLGRFIERSARRHYPSRVFATAASVLLGLGIYDTQCGAKLFRSSSTLKAIFREPFITRWLFDIEIIARVIETRRGTELPPPEDIIYEYPLTEWRDIAGSKVKALDLIRGVMGLAHIYRRYLRVRPTTTINGRPGRRGVHIDSRPFTYKGSRKSKW